MRVLHFQKTAGLSGSERHLLTLLPLLRRAGVDAQICLLEAPGAERFRDPLIEAGVPTMSVPMGRDIDPGLPRRLRSLLQEVKPNLVHTHLIHADLYAGGAAHRLGIPYVTSVHATHSFLGRWPIRQLARRSLGRAERVVAISEHVRRYLISLDLIEAENVTTVHYGIDSEPWRTGSRAEARASLGLSPDVVALGVASRLVPHKGHDVLIEAFASIHEAVPQARLLIAGDGPLRAQLESQAVSTESRDSIRFLGHVEDITEFMRATDIMVFPTLPGFGEGFGLAALEAMAAGRPLVASQLDSLPEIVVPEETGLLVPPAAAPLADALLGLILDPAMRERLGRNAVKRVDERFSAAPMVSKVQEIYDAVLHQ